MYIYIKDSLQSLMTAKVTDDLLMKGTEQCVRSFAKSSEDRFDVRKLLINETISFNGCDITMSEDGSVSLDFLGRISTECSIFQLLQVHGRSFRERPTPKNMHHIGNYAVSWFGLEMEFCHKQPSLFLLCNKDFRN